MVKSICAKQNKCRLANHFSRQFDEAVTKVFTASSIVKEEKSQKIKVFTASSTVKERRPSQHTHF